MFDPLAERVPAFYFTSKIKDTIQPEKKWAQRELLSRISSLFAASIVDLVSSITYIVATAVTAVFAPLKLPFSVLYWILDENQFLQMIHEKVPGITDVVKNALKAALFAINAIFSSLLGLVSPKAMLNVHTHFRRVIV